MVLRFINRPSLENWIAGHEMCDIKIFPRDKLSTRYVAVSKREHLNADTHNPSASFLGHHTREMQAYHVRSHKPATIDPTLHTLPVNPLPKPVWEVTATRRVFFLLNSPVFTNSFGMGTAPHRHASLGELSPGSQPTHAQPFGEPDNTLKAQGCWWSRIPLFEGSCFSQPCSNSACWAESHDWVQFPLLCSEL